MQFDCRQSSLPSSITATIWPFIAAGNSEAIKSRKQDLFEHPDFYCTDDLLSDEHKLIRGSMRLCKREITLT